MDLARLTGTVPEHYVELLFDYLNARDRQHADILGEQKPPSNPARGVPVEQWQRLLQRAADHLDDPQLGLHLGQTIAPRHLGVLGYVTLACENLAAALLRLERYQRLICDYAPMQVTAGADYVDLSWDTRYGRPGPLVDETAITTLVEVCRRMADDRMLDTACMEHNPRLVCFVNPAPLDVTPYTAYFGCPVLFEQPATQIRVPTSLLLLPLKSADPELMRLMEEQADRLLAQLPQRAPVVIHTRRVIAHLLYYGEPSIEKTAAQMNVSPRTLQRRLNTEHTGFRDELTLVRRNLAEKYLRDPGLNIAEIAQLLGYSEHSAFSRSYKNWTGLSPAAWRQRHLGRRVVDVDG